MTTNTVDIVTRGEWDEVTQEKRKGRFLFFFPTKYWVTAKQEVVGHDIYVKTARDIDAVYVNGEKWIKE